MKSATKGSEDATGAINDFIADGLFIGRQRSETFLDLILDMAAKRIGPDASWRIREGKYAPEESQTR